MLKGQVIVLLCVLINVYSNCKSTSCQQRICNCRDDMIFCLDMAVPSFIYKPGVSRLYLERVQILEIESIITALPNLIYLSLIDMKYFNCEWIDDIPTDVIVLTNMCLSSTGIPHKTSGKRLIPPPRTP